MKELPVECRLTPFELKKRRDGVLHGLLSRSQECLPLAEGYRWRFEPSADVLAAAVARTVDAERQCCWFLRFVLIVEPGEGPLWLEITGPKGTSEFLRALMPD